MYRSSASLAGMVSSVEPPTFPKRVREQGHTIARVIVVACGNATPRSPPLSDRYGARTGNWRRFDGSHGRRQRRFYERNYNVVLALLGWREYHCFKVYGIADMTIQETIFPAPGKWSGNQEYEQATGWEDAE